MNVERHQAVIIGGGPAGLAAAIRLRQKGVDDVVVLEREHRPGGILRQCIHDGFGLTRFGETLSGPEYAQRFVAQAEELGITCLTDTTVLSLEADRTVTASGPAGLKQLRGDAVILPMGCRERTRGAIAIPGDRPAGIFTAGTAQRYINIEGWMVGRRVVILGSGDIGLIMARRMTLEGANVLACVELMPYSNGLNRNIVQCLKDYGIPLYLSHTITNIVGRERVEQVVVSEVGADRRPIPGTEIKFDCDTVLLSVGLIPENELTRAAGIPIDSRTSGAVVFENMETVTPGIFSCGNVVHVHDLVDFVTAESRRAGAAAARYAAALPAGEAERYRTVLLTLWNLFAHVEQVECLVLTGELGEEEYPVLSRLAGEIHELLDPPRPALAELGLEGLPASGALCRAMERYRHNARLLLEAWEKQPVSC